jgi:3-oxoacyl-(acyl-carrier-protein) synthase
MKTVITDYDCISAYGRGVNPLWEGLSFGKTALSPSPTQYSHLQTGHVGIAPEDALGTGESRVMQLVSPIAAGEHIRPPRDAALMVASTVGEINYLEEAVLNNSGNAEQSRLLHLPGKIASCFQLSRPGILISSACASSTVALTRADALIREGRESAALIVGVDAISEFILAGFASLMALDPEIARPFDRDRAGLSAGEGAAAVLLMSEERAREEGRTPLARIVGGGMSCDANHMTGPSRDGAGLARAIQKAHTRLDKHSIALIAAHGTGTLYNDAMEMKALKKVFDQPRPTFSVKGGTGHTMGGAGLIQAIAAVQALSAGSAPPTVGLSHVSKEAEHWCSGETQPLEGNRGLVVNAGFGGVNAAVILEVPE